MTDTSDTQISAQQALKSVEILLEKMKTDLTEESCHTEENWHIDASPSSSHIINHHIYSTDALHKKIINMKYTKSRHDQKEQSSDKESDEKWYVINLLILLPCLIEAIKSQAITLNRNDQMHIGTIHSYLTTKASTLEDDIKKVYETDTTDTTETTETTDKQQDTIQKTKNLGETLQGLAQRTSCSLYLSSMWRRAGTPQPLGDEHSSCQIYRKP